MHPYMFRWGTPTAQIRFAFLRLKGDSLPKEVFGQTTNTELRRWTQYLVPKYSIKQMSIRRRRRRLCTCKIYVIEPRHSSSESLSFSAMIEKQQLKSSLEKALRDAGFFRKAGSWYRSGADAIVVLNLQKSDFGDNYYLNIGINLKALSQESFPKVNICHIQMRADDLLDEVTFLRCFNLDKGVIADLKVFIDLLDRKLLHLLNDFLCIDRLREQYKNATFKKALLFWQARELLEIG